MFAEYLKAFVIGGLLCAIAQILIDKTKLTPARILVAYVCSGVLLGAIGVYGPLADFAGAGATSRLPDSVILYRPESVRRSMSTACSAHFPVRSRRLPSESRHLLYFH